MKKLLLITSFSIFSVLSLFGGNQNISNLISSSDWNTIFPNRAQAGHPQGATDDFYSYAKFTAAVDEISNYTVTFSSGPGGQGTSVAVSKADGSSWTYIINSSSWDGVDYTVDYSTFCNTGNDYNDKRELAAFLANITKETTGGWADPDPTQSAANQPTGSHGSWGLYWLRELGPGGSATQKSTNCYTTGSTIDYQPAPGKCYYGRGPIQLSYFYNYGNFSEFLYNNTSLVSNPDLLEQNGELAFLSAIWFWMTPQCPKPSCHQVMQEIYDESATSYSKAKMSKKGFLHTVNIINGSVECHDGAWDSAKPVLRSKLYRYYMSLIGFTSTEISNEDMGDYSTLCNESGSNMQAYTSCDFQNVVVNNCSAPDLGADKELSGGQASLDANITLKNGETIAWYKDGVLISGATNTTYTATEAGTYKAVVTGTDCTREDIIVISEEVFICSQPNLGADKELSGGTASLDANITLQNGESIAWYKDDVLINGATNTTYTATEAGTYKAVVTGTGCSNEDEIIIYNEGDGPSCSIPDLGADKELSSGSAVLDINVTLKNGETVAWYKDGSVIWGASGTTYTATSVGTYKAVITGTDCSEEDEIIISAETIVCSVPDLGPETSLTNGSVTLDANITLKNGETITWYKDGVTLWGINTTTYNATELGTYKVVVSNGSYCSEEDEVIVSETTCSTPDLGDDVSLCQGSTITLDANIVLDSAETITWYKDDVEINGATATTYSVSAAGDYKAEVNGPNNCVRIDEITVADGGAQTLQVNASNNGEFCAHGFNNSVTLTVTGGGGTYDFYDVATDGSPLGSGASFTVDDNLVAEGETKTFYVQEPGGNPDTLVAVEAYTTGTAWTDFTSDQGWNDHRMFFNTFDDVTLESIDLVFGYKAAGPYTITITIYEAGTNNVVVTKQVTLDGNTISTAHTAPYPMNTVDLGIDIPSGNYEMSFIGSTFVIQVVSLGSGSDVGYTNASYSSVGVAEVVGCNRPSGTNYPQALQNTHVGAYNWVFVAGGAGACGRASVDVTANCGITTAVNELQSNSIAVYPNPANEMFNIDLSAVNSKQHLVELYNSFGQLVVAEKINSTTGNVSQFDTGKLEDGLYFVKVVSNGNVYTTSVVISK